MINRCIGNIRKSVRIDAYRYFCLSIHCYPPPRPPPPNLAQLPYSLSVTKIHQYCACLKLFKITCNNIHMHRPAKTYMVFALTRSVAFIYLLIYLFCLLHGYCWFTIRLPITPLLISLLLPGFHSIEGNLQTGVTASKSGSKEMP